MHNRRIFFSNNRSFIDPHYIGLLVAEMDGSQSTNRISMGPIRKINAALGYHYLSRIEMLDLGFANTNGLIRSHAQNIVDSTIIEQQQHSRRQGEKDLETTAVGPQDTPIPDSTTIRIASKHRVIRNNQFISKTRACHKELKIRESLHVLRKHL
jgi:hypothetical protein